MLINIYMYNVDVVAWSTPSFNRRRRRCCRCLIRIFANAQIHKIINKASAHHTSTRSTKMYFGPNCVWRGGAACFVLVLVGWLIVILFAHSSCISIWCKWIVSSVVIWTPKYKTNWDEDAAMGSDGTIWFCWLNAILGQPDSWSAHL